MNAPTRPPVDTIGRSVPEWIGATPDTPVPKRVKLRVFERWGGVCYLSGRKIRPGDLWDVEHVRALSLYGENRESNLRPALKEAHKAKTADDVKAKAKADRQRAKHLGIWPKSKRPIKSRGFGNSRRDILAGMALGFVLGVGTLAYLNDRLSAQPPPLAGYPQATIRDNFGGRTMTMVFENMGKVVQFEGVCASACAYLADLKARAGQACITPRTVLLFHAHHDGEKWLPETPTLYRPEVSAWVLANGGFPQERAANRITAMPYRVARQFWPTCPSAG